MRSAKITKLYINGIQPETENVIPERVTDLEDGTQLNEDVAQLKSDVSDINRKASGIKLEEDQVNKGKLIFTDFEGGTTPVQGGFLPDDDTIKLTSKDELAIKKVYVDSNTMSGDGASSNTALSVNAIQENGVRISAYNLNNTLSNIYGNISNIQEINTEQTGRLDDLDREVSAIEGTGGYLIPHDFNTTRPDLPTDNIIAAGYSVTDKQVLVSNTFTTFTVDVDKVLEFYDNHGYTYESGLVITLTCNYSQGFFDSLQDSYGLEHGADFSSDFSITTDGNVELGDQIRFELLEGYDPETSTLSLLTQYALTQITSIDNPLQIWNGTRVTNTYNNHTWILNNTPDTNPAIFEWIDLGQALVNIATTDTLGVVLSSTNNYEGAVDLVGHITINNLTNKLSQIDTSISTLEGKVPVVYSTEIEVNDWNTGTQTVTKNFPEITSTNVVIVSPDPSTEDIYDEAEIEAISQINANVTFQYQTIPTGTVKVNLIIINVEESL